MYVFVYNQISVDPGIGGEDGSQPACLLPHCWAGLCTKGPPRRGGGSAFPVSTMFSPILQKDILLGNTFATPSAF